MTCQELVELVTDYLEDVLESPRRAWFEAHLATCPHCRVYLEQMRATIRVLGRLTPETLPPGAEAALLAHLRRLDPPETAH